MTDHVRVALLRGVNVGGHHKIPMAELRELASRSGFDRVATYIQSGNLVLVTALDEAAAVAALEAAVESRFGFTVPVVMRSAAELASIAAAHPLAGVAPDGRRLMVAFLDAVPEVDVADVIEAADHEPDRFVGRGREVYLAYPHGAARSKLTHTLLQQRLGVRATLRNWNTVRKLTELAAREVERDG